MIMSAAALLAKNPKPADADIDTTMTNLCRCGTYARVKKAIHALAGDYVAPAAKQASIGPEAHISSLPPEGAQASLGAARREAFTSPEAHIRSLPPEGAQASLGAARREA
jgi:xanthine dehydrogenase iron-sulfur cluster and FAD-binding subunit A